MLFGVIVYSPGAGERLQRFSVEGDPGMGLTGPTVQVGCEPTSVSSTFLFCLILSFLLGN